MRFAADAGAGADGRRAEAELDAWQRRMHRPDNEVGWVVPVSVVLARTPDVALALTHLTAFTTGVALTLAVRLRVAPDGLPPGELYQRISPYPGLGADLDPDQRLLLGVEYADGRTATNLRSGGWPAAPVDDDEPVLAPEGGGGSELSVDNGFWLSPVPPDGPFAVVCAWGAFGIRETTLVIEHADLATASTRSTTLWAVPPVHHPPAPAREPRLPTTGWFGRAAHEGTSGRDEVEGTHLS